MTVMGREAGSTQSSVCHTTNALPLRLTTPVGNVVASISPQLLALWQSAARMTRGSSVIPDVVEQAAQFQQVAVSSLPRTAAPT